MVSTFDCAELSWHVSGYTPDGWRLRERIESPFSVLPEIGPVPISVPVSVQKALLEAGIIPDYYVGTNYRQCEWVENLEWRFITTIPKEWFIGKETILEALGLDGAGMIFFNEKRILDFDNAFHPYRVVLKDPLPENNKLEIHFFVPPRWLGNPSCSSKIVDWKPRFNYTWDWMVRSVQIGIWDTISIISHNQARIESLKISTDYNVTNSCGELKINGTGTTSGKQVVISLSDATGVVDKWVIDCQRDCFELESTNLDIKPWWSNTNGDHPLYTVVVELRHKESGHILHTIEKQVGFKHVAWQQNKNAPVNADPWICELNGTPIFLRGVNWTPIRPYFADVTEDMYRLRLEHYRNAGLNLMRVWGGAFLEKECFYRLCDEMGMLVWQEFPLSSSGPDNSPPSDAKSLRHMESIARSYIARRSHHVSLLMWCGGNELQTLHDGSPGIGKPLDTSHPMLKLLDDICKREDPGRRFMPTSASGPRFEAKSEFGLGLHWDVHGPWGFATLDSAEVEAFWDKDDALFRSETGHGSASPAALLKAHYPGIEKKPISRDSEFWNLFGCWVESEPFEKAHGRLPETIDEFVAWTQKRQANHIAIAARKCFARFPGIGGILIWMGHDSFPCTANSSIIDFNGDPKPALGELKKIFNNGMVAKS